MWDTFKDYLKAFFNSRLLPIAVIYILLFSVLVNEMFKLQIVESDEIVQDSSSTTPKERSIKATRGNIYDCNGKLLAYNKLSYNVTFMSTTQFSKEMTSEQKNAEIYRVIRLVEDNGGTMDVDFFIELDRTGVPQYSVDGNTRYRYIAEAYGTTVQKMTQEQKDITAKDLYHYLRYDVSTSSPSFDIGSLYDDETALKIMAIRYSIYINRFTQYKSITLAKNVSDITVAAIQENSSELPGVSIDQDTIRAYKKSKYFAHMLGYTGSISEEKLEQLKEEGNTNYTTDDQIGVSGLESTYEEYLQGSKGTQALTIDEKTSRIVDVKTTQNPVAGNDLYLTIDAKLQEEAYRLLEEHIAGILIANINNSTDAGTRGVSTKSIKVPIYDVYNALVENNIVDVSRFTDSDASKREKQTYRKYQQRQKAIFKRLKGYLDVDSTLTNKRAPKRMQEFLSYFYTILKENGIVNKDKIDIQDDTYLKYNNGNLSLSKYLQYGISQGWVDLEKLNIGENSFYSTEEVYKKLVDYGMNLLENDTKCTKMVYSYMVYTYELSGKDLCLMLFDQGDIKYNETEYNQLLTGTLSAYSFITQKIRKLVITPGQLGLDPCSGSLIVTDVNTGVVRAMVTYPSYDNNKMANQVDSQYFYSYLSDNTASPLINRPTQVELAPGSTFKIVSSVTGLEEGVITPSTVIYDRVVFDKVYGNPRCWSSAGHGNLTVATAIENSCNYFFYTVGYLLSGKSKGNVNNARGLSRLKKYAEMFGLLDKSGVEMTEAEPQFATKDAVRAAIGQDNQAYTPIQLSRYVTTIANNGTCYDLTLIDQIKDVSGKVVLNNEAKIRNKVSIADSTWNAVHRGMYLVVNGPDSEVKPSFQKVNKTVAGKTGTAQQNTLHPNHAYFISYAPYNNPKISVTCVIPNGYASANAASTASDVYKYYFSKKKKSVSGGEAKISTTNQVTD